MALNWAMLDPSREPVPLPHEMTITTIASPGVDLSLSIPEAPSSSSTAGAPGAAKKLKESGAIWVTDQRLVFVGPPSSSVESLSIPLHQIIGSRFEQPMFGTNYLSLDIAPSPDGGLVRGTTAEIRFRDQALFGFVRVLEKTREHAIETRHNNQASADEADGLPAYCPSGTSSSSSAAPVAAGASSSTAATASQPPPPPHSDAPPGYDAPSYEA